MRPQERTISAAPFVMRKCSFQLSLRQIPQGPLFFDFKDEAHYHPGSGSRHFGHSLADEFANGARDSRQEVRKLEAATVVFSTNYFTKTPYVSC